jgi:nitrate reductase delta subunit
MTATVHGVAADRAAWQVASLLLAYPDEELPVRLPLVRRVARALPRDLGEPLEQFVAHCAATPVLELAAHYVETFDHRRRCCLYLTYYAHGDTRNRGMALLAFKSAYRRAGLELDTGELPDHLAVVLEFAATADTEAGRQLLLDHRAGIELLRLALQEAGSPYVHVLRAVTATLPPLRGDEHAAVARLAAEGPPVEEVGLVPFGPPDHTQRAEGARR